MKTRHKIKVLISKAQNGDQDAVAEIVQRFIPAVKKYSRWMGYEEAYADLIVWLVSNVYKYKSFKGAKPTTTYNNIP